MEKSLSHRGPLYGGEMCSRIAQSNPAMKIILVFTASLTWAFQLQAEPPKYQHRDPVTSELLLCDQCPPGTAVKQHCTPDGPTLCRPCPERHYAEHWHWRDTCQYCTSVCKERQLVKQQCNSTHDQLCECAPGFHLEVEFCIIHNTCPIGYGVAAAGTPESDTVCERCPQGSFSSVGSPTEACRPHKNCSALGLKLLRAGTPSSNTLCSRPGKNLAPECSLPHIQCNTDMTLCEETIFQSLASLQLSAVPVERLMESLPGRRVDRKGLERLRKACDHQQQILQLLRLWKERNRDQDKLYGIIQGVNLCERKVSRCGGLKNVSLDHLRLLSDSLPGARVSPEAVTAVTASCPPAQHVLQLLHLWKRANPGQDLAKALNLSQKALRGTGAPRALLRAVKKVGRVLGTTTVHKIYEKMFAGVPKDDSCFKTHKPLNE
ncbi:tumor necrosis factor receptor superfamily member 11B-like isoform X2 [Gadus macrocephalus]|uniref:tumor necrosis factor receptor superfamily member 11B-like isoform X2 n=1 Tax=Gadus macrocephalus TaxID=80720 RepID=UPI0028CB5715|nr:tumor necrosis factor receptor superfamily member 11B-like isoform X2 [Gadus macrocephalus]